MASAFHGIEVSKRSIITHQQALYTTGHNIANLNTPGYSRQRVDMQTLTPLELPSMQRSARPGQLGQGVEVQQIIRIRDRYVEAQIRAEVDGKSYWHQREHYLHTIERVMNEPGDLNIRTRMGEVWAQWQTVSTLPMERAPRAELREKALTLTRRINHIYHAMQNLQNEVDAEVVDRVNDINNITAQIVKLNEQIENIEALGDNPNDLLDRRDMLIEKLAQLATIQVSEQDPDEYIIYFEGQHLVQGTHREELAAIHDPSTGLHHVYWESGTDRRPLDYQIINRAPINGGELAALLEVRDVDIQFHIDQLNSLAITLIDVTNEMHRDGFGLNLETDHNFYRYRPITEQQPGEDLGDFVRTHEGIPAGMQEITALYKVSGTQVLDLNAEVGSAGTIVLEADENGAPLISVDYTETDKVRTVIYRINHSGADVSAYLDHRGRLALRARVSIDRPMQEDFTLRHLEDSGAFLHGTSGLLNAGAVFDWQGLGGANNFASYTPGGLNENIAVTPDYNPAGWITVDDAIMRDVDHIAAAKGDDFDGDGNPETISGVGDGRNALEIADMMKFKNVMVETNETLEDFFEEAMADLGSEAEQARLEFENREQIVHNLINIRESISGVNLDEELAQMLAYQHGYNAGARLVTVFDKMLDVIINRMGV